MAALVLQTKKGFVGIPCHAITEVDLADNTLYVNTVEGNKIIIVKDIKDADNQLPEAIVDISDNPLLRLFNMALGN